MPLAVSGGRLLVIDGALATGCCCGEDSDESGYWWCIDGKCYQSELSPEAVTHGRYMSRAACERRCLNGAGLCPCCEEPNVVTGKCQECDEACSDQNNDDEACECEDYPYCSEKQECGCCMTCVDFPETGVGRCVPCPDGTICIDPGGSGNACRCVPFEECLEHPERCPIPDPPPGWGYECSRNLCGDPDCKLSRSGIHPTLLDCYRSCRDDPAPNCGIEWLQNLTSSGERKSANVKWKDYLFSVQAAKADICVSFKNPTNGPFRVLIKGPVLDRNCRMIASNVVHRDSGWRRGRAGCGCTGFECAAPEKQRESQYCQEFFPDRPFCCLESCQDEPCECLRCCRGQKNGYKCEASRSGFLKWRKRRGITHFIVRVLTDDRCPPAGLDPPNTTMDFSFNLCLRVTCGGCYDFSQLECRMPAFEGPLGACCGGGSCSDDVDKCLCESIPNARWLGKDSKCEDIDCCAGFPCGGGKRCPAGCCCGRNGCTDSRNAVVAGCGPPCCLPDGGCQPNTHETVCAGLGGVSMPDAIDCREALCCTAVGKGACPPDQFCCTRLPAPGSDERPTGECCRRRDQCCVDGVCTDCQCIPPCGECEECLNGVCTPCAQLNKQCCSGKCHTGPCPACCTRNGCVDGLNAGGCTAVGGTTLAGTCATISCCEAVGSNDCGEGKVCCGNPDDGFTCCKADCCIDDVCDCGDCADDSDCDDAPCCINNKCEPSNAAEIVPNPNGDAVCPPGYDYAGDAGGGPIYCCPPPSSALNPLTHPGQCCGKAGCAQTAGTTQPPGTDCATIAEYNVFGGVDPNTGEVWCLQTGCAPSASAGTACCPANCEDLDPNSICFSGEDPP